MQVLSEKDYNLIESELLTKYQKKVNNTYKTCTLKTTWCTNNGYYSPCPSGQVATNESCNDALIGISKIQLLICCICKTNQRNGRVVL